MRACLALGLVACASAAPPADEDDPCSAPGEPTLEIGLGLDGYEPLDNGDPMPLIHGPQGGYHLEIGLQATNLAADALIGGYLVGEIDGVVLAESAPFLDFRCKLPEAPVQESWGTLLVFEAEPADLDGQTAIIRVEVTDADGTVVSAEASFVIEDTGGDAPAR